MDKVVIVVKDGMIQEVYGSSPDQFDVEIIDLDFNEADEEMERTVLDGLQTVQQYLCKIY